MPGGDRTGPMGTGPMTGRRAGYCAGFGMPGVANAGMPWQGIGFGFRGGRHSWRNMYYSTGITGWQRFGYGNPTPQDEAETLKTQAKWLQDQLDAINKRLDELKQS